jgi:hypothetical protein
VTASAPRVVADLECGSIANARILSASSVAVEVQSSTEFGLEGSLETWICGRVVAAEEAVEVVVTNEHGNMRYLRPVASFDRESWQHVSQFGMAVNNESVTYRFMLPTSKAHDHVAFATWWPYTFSRCQRLVAELSEHSFVSAETIGRSVEGRPIAALVISEGTPTATLVLSAECTAARHRVYTQWRARRAICAPPRPATFVLDSVASSCR